MKTQSLQCHWVITCLDQHQQTQNSHMGLLCVWWGSEKAEVGKQQGFFFFFARSWNQWWNRAMELQWFLSSALLCHSASWVSWILFITCKPSKNKSHYSGQKALWLKGCIFYYLCLCSPQIINKALGNLALIMLPAFIALPCPRCARSVPLFGFSIISREAQTSRCTLWCTLLLPCPSSELTGLALGAPCRAAWGCCWPFPSLPFLQNLLGFQYQNHSWQRDNLSLSSPPKIRENVKRLK